MSDQLSPFHTQAEDVGAFVYAARARDAAEDRRERPVSGPSENTD